MIRREKIHNYLSEKGGGILSRSDFKNTLYTLHKSYSGFVHGASPHIMEMYGGKPPYFHTKGLLGTDRMEEYEDDFFTYVYRSYISHVYVAKSFGMEDEFNRLVQALNDIEKAVGF